LEALLKEFQLIQKLKPTLNQQYKIHERSLTYSIPKDFILILPSVNSEYAEIFIILQSQPVHQIRMSLKKPDFQIYCLPKKV